MRLTRPGVKKSVLKACPNTQFLIGGYSKGSMCVHQSSFMLSDEEKNSIKGVVTFGVRPLLLSDHNMLNRFILPRIPIMALSE